MSKIAFYTLGCKSNQYETDVMKRSVVAAGHEIVPFNKQADCYIINTCTVTMNADKKSRNAIRSAKKRNPDSKIIVTGCYVETKHFSIEQADVILKNKDKFNVAEFIRDARPEMRDVKSLSSPISHLASSRVRANLMVENGCENFCSYCIVPFVRGKIISKSFDQALAEAKQMVKDGVKEIVLTGINLGEYKTDSSSPISSLPSLINEISKIEGLLRIRLSSIEPQYVDNPLIKIINENPKVCKHLHIPLQSGDGGILKAMNRNYTSKDFLAMVKKIKDQIKNVAVTTDIIVGFPGEDEKAFKNTLKLADKARFSRIHIFSYSDRPGTAASKLPNKVDPRVINARRTVLDRKRAKYMLEFHRSFRKRPLDVLIEHKDRKSGLYEGLTSNYIRVFLSGDDMGDDCVGRLIQVKFKRFQGENVIACLQSP